MATLDTRTVQSPGWWVQRLYTKLTARKPSLEQLNDYYTGNFPLPFLPEKTRDAYRRLLKMSRANYMELAVDSTANRLQVAGFQTGPGEGSDDAAWAIWQANNMDGYSAMLITETLVNGIAYLMAAPTASRMQPLLTVEHPAQAIVECMPGNRRERAAALKLWRDDWTAMVCATLYLPDAIYKFEAPDKSPQGNTGSLSGGTVSMPAWQPRQVAGEDWPAPNPLGVVPIVEVPNRPRMLMPGRSEIASVMDIQDRINKTIADRMVTQEYAAFIQKWATGLDIPVDENGQLVEPFDIAVNRLIVAEDADAKFGQFDASPLAPYLAACDADIKDIASITATPPHYLLGEMVNLSADALKSAEAGLVHKIYSRRVAFEEPLEEAMRIAMIAAGQPAGPTTASRVVWRSPEWRTEGELVDALLKMSSLGVPREVLWQKWGASPQEIERWKAMAAQEQAMNSLESAAALFAPKPQVEAPVA